MPLLLGKGGGGIFVNYSYQGLFLIPLYVTLFGYSENVQITVHPCGMVQYI